MKLQFTVPVICAAIVAGASAFASSYALVAGNGLTGPEMMILGWNTLTAVIAALAHDSKLETK